MEKMVLTIFSFDSVTYGSSSQKGQTLIACVKKEGRDKGSVMMTISIDRLMNLKRFNPLIVGRGRYGWSGTRMTSKDKGKWLVPRGQAWGCFLCGKVVDRRSRSSHVPFLLLSRAPREKRQSFFGRFVDGSQRGQCELSI